MKVRAFKYGQQDRVMYSTVLGGKTLASISEIDSVERDPANGYQREHLPERSEELARFIEQVHGLVPGAILMNIRPEREGELNFTNESDEGDIEFGTLEMPDDKFTWVIDGQHRVRAFEQLSEDILVPAVFIKGADRSEEARIFFVVNSKQKNVSASLRYHDLMRYADDDLKRHLEGAALKSEELAYKIAIELNKDTLWKDKINLTGARGMGRAINLKGFMDALEPVTKDGWFTTLPSFDTQLEHVKTFWRAVNRTWPSSLDLGSSSLLTRTFGVFVACGIAVGIFHYCNHLNQIDEDTMVELLEPTKSLVDNWDPEGVLRAYSGGGRKAVNIAIEVLKSSIKKKFTEMLQLKPVQPA